MQRVAPHLYLRGRNYTFRRAIPEHARSAFGGIREYVRSLGDVSRRKADELAGVHRAYCSRMIEEAAGRGRAETGVSALLRIKRVPEREDIEGAVRVWLRQHEADGEAFAAAGRQAADDHVRDLGFLKDAVQETMQARRGSAPLTTKWIADHLAEANGWTLPGDSQLRGFLEDRVARGQRELSARITAELNWEDQPPPTHRMFSPEAFAADQARSPAKAQRQAAPLMTVFEGYEREKQPEPATVKAWKSALTSLIAHLGHDDAAGVTSEDIVAWKNALIAERKDGEPARGQYTVRHKYLGAVKPVFGWAKANKLIEANPVVGVSVAVPKRKRMRAEAGFTEAEAKIVLGAALAIDCEADKSFTALARRWLPWLCAYSGARVGELSQLRRQDIGRTDDGIWFMTITPEAGSQKQGFTRQVALHPHVIEQGFLDVVKKSTGPIFYDPSRKRKGSTGNPQHKKVGERVARWVRSLGITDEELQPNHGWRHRFATIARHIDMDPDISRAIVGHAAKDVHQGYGDVLIQSSYRWLTKFPRYTVNGTTP